MIVSFLFSLNPLKIVLFTLDSSTTNLLEAYYSVPAPTPTTHTLTSEMEVDDILESTTPIPKTLELVYWDYYHTDTQSYTDKIRHHRQLGFDPWVAGGVWTWNRLWTALPFTFKATSACVKACRDSEVRNVFVTVWGDGKYKYYNVY